MSQNDLTSEPLAAHLRSVYWSERSDELLVSFEVGEERIIHLRMSPTVANAIHQEVKGRSTPWTATEWWWKTIFSFSPQPTLHPQFLKAAERMISEPFHVYGDAEQLLADQQKNVEFAVAATSRLEDRVHNTMLLCLGSASLMTASFVWTPKPLQYITLICLACLVLVFAMLFKLRFTIDKPVYPLVRCGQKNN